MAITLRSYAHNTQLTAAGTVIIQVVPSNTKAVVKKLSFYNSGVSNREITIYVVEASGNADTGNTEIKKTISPGSTWSALDVFNEVLETGMSLQATVDAGTDVNVNCSGADVT